MSHLHRPPAGKQESYGFPGAVDFFPMSGICGEYMSHIRYVHKTAPQTICRIKYNGHLKYTVGSP